MADTTADEIQIFMTDLAEGVDVFFLFVCTVLVLMMQAGFALYEVCTSCAHGEAGWTSLVYSRVSAGFLCEERSTRSREITVCWLLRRE